MVRKLNEACGIGVPGTAAKEEIGQEFPKEIQKESLKEVAVKSELSAPITTKPENVIVKEKRACC